MNVMNPLECRLRQNEKMYRAAGEVFEGPPRVFRFYDQNDEVSMDVMISPHPKREGICSYTTLGLIHYPVGQRRGGRPFRIELAGAASTEFEYYPNLLSQCAFEIINARFHCQEGAVLGDFVNTYVPDSKLPHLLFCRCGFWEQELPEQELEDKTTGWLTVVPISTAELAFLEQHSFSALLAEFYRRKTDLTDLLRPSIF